MPSRLFGVSGKKALRKHNLYGLTPNMGSAHQLLVIKKPFKCFVYFRSYSGACSCHK